MKKIISYFLGLPLTALLGLGCSAPDPSQNAADPDADGVQTVSSVAQAISTGCDPINTYCQAVTSQACELTEDVVERVSDYVCVLVPDPKWYNPGNMKKKCLTEYKDRLIKGSSTCSNVLGLSCPSVTGVATLSCDAVMNVVSDCLNGSSSACVQAQGDAAIAAAFGPTCAAYTIYQSGLLEASYESRLYGLVDAELDAENKNVFGTLLGDTAFDDYVRGTVAFYKTSDAALTATATASNVQRAKTTPGKVFFNTTTPDKDLIMHELTHAWQYRHRGVQGQTTDGCVQFISGRNGLLKHQYYFTLAPGKPFSTYGVEQQAQIVQIYYQYKYSMVDACPAEFENCASYASPAARQQALRDAIAGVSASNGALFSGTCVSQGCAGPAQACAIQSGRFEVSGNNFNCYPR